MNHHKLPKIFIETCYWASWPSFINVCESAHMSLCVYVCHLRVGFPGCHKKAQGCSDKPVMSTAQWRLWELTSGPLGEQQALYTAKPRLQLPYFTLIDNYNTVMGYNVKFWYLYVTQHTCGAQSTRQESSPTTWVLGVKLQSAGLCSELPNPLNHRAGPAITVIAKRSSWILSFHNGSF